MESETGATRDTANYRIKKAQVWTVAKSPINMQYSRAVLIMFILLVHYHILSSLSLSLSHSLSLSPNPISLLPPFLFLCQYTALIRRFRDVMEEYNQMQDEYRDKSKERIQRQLKYGTHLV